MNTKTCLRSEIDFYGHKIGVIKDAKDNYFLNPDDCETILDVPEQSLKEYIESNFDFLKEAVYGGIVFQDDYVSSFVIVLYWLSELSKGSNSAETILMTFANEALFSRLKSKQFS